MTFVRSLAIALLLVAAPLRAEQIQVAAAADLRFALDEIVSLFRKAHPTDSIEVSYGSSGKFYAQIRNGAPFDLFFSADIELPEKLVQAGLAGPDVRAYALGRIVVWRAGSDAPPLALADLVRPEIRRIAIANPRHAPYGMRAVEALKAAQVWKAVESRLVHGENIAQTAQFVQTGNADVGFVALSQVLQGGRLKEGSMWMIPQAHYEAIRQDAVILKKGANNEAAQALVRLLQSPNIKDLIRSYGYEI